MIEAVPLFKAPNGEARFMAACDAALQHWLVPSLRPISRRASTLMLLRPECDQHIARRLAEARIA